MAYGTIKVDNITFDNGGVDKLITVSGLFYSTSGALTVTGTISGGNVTAPTATFTTLTGTTTVGTTATFTSGSFTSVTGTTVTGTTANFTSGVFTTRVSGTTVTGTTANFTSGNFISLSGTTTTVTSGVFSAGSATAPSVAVGTGTTYAPGIYSPGTDQLAISTSGTGRLFVDAGGNVGVGTASPFSTNGTNLHVLSTGTARLWLQSTTASTGRQFYLESLGTGGLTVVDGTAGQERLRITSAGNVGIGVSSPQGIVESKKSGASTTPNLVLTSGGAGDPSSVDPSIQFAASALESVGTTKIMSTGAYGSRALAFHTGTDGAGTEKARIDSSGNLGLGVVPSTWASFGSAFEIAGKGNFIGGNSTQTYLGNNSYYNAAWKYVNTAASSYYLQSAGSHAWYNAPSGTAGNTITFTQAMTLDASGRLGIGTTSPAYQFQVSTDSAGKPSSALWTIVSDERIKEDIELADLDLCYEAIKAIPLKRYKWRYDIYTAEQVTDRRKLGWIAKDVEAIFPKAVGRHEFKYNQVFEKIIIPAVEEELDDEGNVITPAQPERIEQGALISEDVIEDCRDLNSDQLYAAMYGAVQKLIAKVETLEASNTNLLTRLSALEAV